MAKPGTLMRNTMGIETANGPHVPQFKCKYELRLEMEDGSVRSETLHDVLVLEGKMRHTLVSIGSLAYQSSVGTWIAPDTETSYFRFRDGATAPLVNVGVLVIPEPGRAVRPAAALKVMYFRGLLVEMGLEQTTATPLYVDNQGAVELSRDRKSCHRSRHVDRRFFKVREREASGAVSVREINTNDNPADLLTKSLLFDPFRRHSMSLLGKSAPERAHSRARGVIASMTVCLPSEGGDERSDERVCARDCMCATRRW